MAKQRRPRPKKTSKKPVRPARKAAIGRSRSNPQQQVQAVWIAPPVRVEEPPPPPSERQLKHGQAVSVYESGLQAVQQRQYAEAARLLRSVLETFPEEKELHERAQLYLNVCNRQLVPRDATPQTIEERVYAATLAVNAGAYDQGLTELESLSREHPDNDHVHYMLAVAHTLRRDLAPALTSLQRAVELNQENRFLAWQDADLESLREHPRFRLAVGVPGRRDRRDASRARALR
jgi:tetratricopeptide (TPR) repeat protein